MLIPFKGITWKLWIQILFIQSGHDLIMATLSCKGALEMWSFPGDCIASSGLYYSAVRGSMNLGGNLKFLWHSAAINKGLLEAEALEGLLERWNKELDDQNNHGCDRGKHLSSHKVISPWNSVDHGEELSWTQMEMKGKGANHFIL